MKKIQSILALLMALVLLAAPAGAMAEGGVVSFTLSNPTLEIGENAYPIDVTIELSGGLDDSMNRAFLTLNALSGEEAALTALGALENGVITAYVNGMNQYISLPFDMESVISEVQTNVESYISEEIGDIEAFASAFENLPEPTIDEDAVAELLEMVESFYEGEEDVSLDDGAFVLTCDVYAGSLTLEDVVELVDLLDRCLSGYISEAFVSGFYTGLGMTDVDASLMTPENIVAAMQEEDVEIAFDFYTYYNEDGFLSFYLECTVTEGETVNTLGFEFEIGTYDPEWLYGFITVTADADGEWAEISLYADNYVEEDGNVKRLMLDLSDDYASYSFNIANELYPDENVTYLNLAMDEGETADFTIAYTIVPDEANPVNHTGLFEALLFSADMEEELYFSVDTALTVSEMPEDELLSITGMTAVDPTSDDMSEFALELEEVLQNALMSLASAPGLTDLMETLTALA